MRRAIIGVVGLAAFAGLFAAPAMAAVTATNITTPADGSVFNPDLNDPSPVNITVSGIATASNGDLVDIYCAYNNEDDLASGTVQDVAVSGGAFSAQLNLQGPSGYSCRLIAVPDGSSPPYDLADFSGPVIRDSGYRLYRVTGGPNDGALDDYLQNSSTPSGYWEVNSAGNCFVYTGYPIDPVSLAFGNPLFGCSRITQDAPFFSFGGQALLLPDAQDDSKLGYTGISSLNHSVDPATGELRVSDSETPVRCVAAGMNDCASYATAGLRLDQTQTGGTNGHTVRVNHRWVNTTGEAKELKVEYRVENVGFGWRFPGESSYSGHSPFDTIAPTPGPASFFLALNPGSSCPGLSDPCGSVTWYRSPDSIEFTDVEAALTYTRTIPAHGSRVLAFDYSQGYPQASVDGYAAAARSGFNTSFTVGKARRNRKRGTARLPVDIPGAGKVAVSGKGIKPASVLAGASASALAHSSLATVPIRPKAKVRRKLNRRGRARVTVTVTYTRTDLDPVTKKVKLTLRKNRR
jgi:hypothetical protein